MIYTMCPPSTPRVQPRRRQESIAAADSKSAACCGVATPTKTSSCGSTSSSVQGRLTILKPHVIPHTIPCGPRGDNSSAGSCWTTSMSDHTFIEDPENSSCLVCSDPDNQEGGLSSSIAPAEHWRQLSRLFGLLTGDEPLQRRIVIFKAWQNIAELATAHSRTRLFASLRRRSNLIESLVFPRPAPTVSLSIRQMLVAASRFGERASRGELGRLKRAMEEVLRKAGDAALKGEMNEERACAERDEWERMALELAEELDIVRREVRGDSEGWDREGETAGLMMQVEADELRRQRDKAREELKECREMLQAVSPELEEAEAKIAKIEIEQDFRGVSAARNDALTKSSSSPPQDMQDLPLASQPVLSLRPFPSPIPSPLQSVASSASGPLSYPVSATLSTPIPARARLMTLASSWHDTLPLSASPPAVYSAKPGAQTAPAAAAPPLFVLLPEALDPQRAPSHLGCRLRIDQQALSLPSTQPSPRSAPSGVPRHRHQGSSMEPPQHHHHHPDLADQQIHHWPLSVATSPSSPYLSMNTAPQASLNLVLQHSTGTRRGADAAYLARWTPADGVYAAAWTPRGPGASPAAWRREMPKEEEEEGCKVAWIGLKMMVASLKRTMSLGYGTSTRALRAAEDDVFFPDDGVFFPRMPGAGGVE